MSTERSSRTRSAARSVGGEVRVLLRLVALVALVLLTVNITTRAWLLARVTPQLNRLQGMSTQLDRLHSATVDEETGLRGYLATGALVFQQPYSLALPRAAAAAQELDKAVPRGTLTRDLLAVELTRQRWADQWAARAADPALLSSIGGPGPAGAERLTVLTDFMVEGKQLFDAYRAAHQTLIVDIDSAEAAAAGTSRHWFLGSGLLEAVIALAVVVVSLGARRRLTRRVTDPVEALAGTVADIRRGNLDARVPITSGPTEMVDLARDIDDMAVALKNQMRLTEDREQQAHLHGERLSIVLAAAREVAGSLSLRYVLDSVSTAALRLGSVRARVWLIDDEDSALTVSFDTAVGRAGGQELLRVPVGTGTVGRAAKYGRPIGPEPLEDGVHAVVVIPMTVGGRVIGVLETMHPVGQPASPETVEVMEALAVHAAGAVTSARLHEQVNTYAVTDALTGLANRRAFDGDLATEVSRAVRHGRPLSVISLDLDHFKDLNDRFGHGYGDLALQQSAEAIRAALRQSDRVYRVGGEELVVLAPETTADDAAKLAERLRAAVEASAGPDAPLVTASFGIAELPSHGVDSVRLLIAADRALYRAKARGRNRVEISDDVLIPAQDSIPTARTSR